MNNKNAFTLVELIVVIAILAILGTIAFVSLNGYTKDARNSKVIYDIANLNSKMQVELSRGIDLDNLITTSRIIVNGVNTGSTIGSGTYILKNLKYDVGYLDFKKLRINGTDFKYETNTGRREYMLGYIKAPNKLSYEFAGEIMNQAGVYIVVIKGNYLQYSSTDARGLISESGSDIGLKNNDYLTGSLY